ncbi:MAG: diguanylate cyclase [Nocardioides sp.]|nr:diguanylate cyclase [Nocardioides sp.]
MQDRSPADRQQLLLDAVLAVGGDLSLQSTLERIVDAARELLDAEYAAIAALDEDTSQVTTFVQVGMPQEAQGRIGHVPRGRGLLGATMFVHEPLRLDDLTTHPYFGGFPDGHPPMHSFLGVPIRVKNRTFGSLYLSEKNGGRPFSAEDEEVVGVLAGAAGVAIENARLYEESRRRGTWLEATAAITTRLMGGDDATEALQTVADRARVLADADMAWVVVGEARDALELKVVSGANADLQAMRTLPLERSIAAEVIESGEPMSVDDIRIDDRAVDVPARLGLPPLGPMIVVPLVSSTGVVGSLSLSYRYDRSEVFRAVDPALPARFAEHAAVCLEVAQGRENQERLAVLEDRDRIGRDLHDLVIQRLFAVCLGLDALSRRSDDEKVANRITEAVDELDSTIKDIRRTIFALGAVEASTDIQSEVSRLVERARQTMKVVPSLTFEGPVRTLVGTDEAPDLLAVLGEALSNAGRHAHARHVDVRVEAGDELVLAVTDDGRGMPVSIAESGLANMRERAERRGGTFEIYTAEGEGTRIVWRVPLAAGR